MVPKTHAIYTAYLSLLVARTTKNTRAPPQMIMIDAGRVRYARLRNHPANMIARTEAAAGGILSS